MEFKGVVTDVQDKSGTSKKGEAFTAYQIVVEEQVDRYPQSGVFDIFGDKVDVPGIGEEVVISFSLKATEWNGKWFGKNNVWKIVSAGGGQAHTPQAEPQKLPMPDPLTQTEQHGSPAANVAAEPAPPSDENGLPF